jgi:hypothetical protein
MAHMGEKRKVYKVLVGKSKGKWSLRRWRRRWEDVIRMDFRETGWGVDWIQLAQDMDQWQAVVNEGMNFLVLASWSELVSLVRLTSLTWVQPSAR